MKKTYFILLIFVFGSIVSCIDDKYDLDRVNTDDITIGDNFVSPLGTVSINSSDLLNLAEGSDVVNVVDNNIILSFAGTANFNVPTTKSQRAPLSLTIDTHELSNIFGADGSNNLSLDDPRITLSLSSNTQIPVPIIFYAVSYKGNDIIDQISADNINITNNTTNYWIGGKSSSVPAGYLFRETRNISNLIAPLPTSITFDFDIKSKIIPNVNVAYKVEMPLAPKSDFSAEFTEKMKDIFDDQIIDALFSSGSVSINAAVSNSFPFEFIMTLVVLDAEDKEIGVDLGTETIISCDANGKISTSDLKFDISASDMEKMKSARHIEVKLSARGTEPTNGMNITDIQTLQLKLSIKKTGGVNVG